MKQLYYAVIFMALSYEMNAQTIVASAHPYDANGNNIGFQFWVENTNAYTIRLFRINMRNDVTANPLTHTYTVWFKPNATNAAPGTISAGNGWTNAGSFVHNQKFNTLYPIISNLAIDIPANSTYRIWVSNADVMGLHIIPTTGVNTFSNGGVNIKTGDSVSWWGAVTNGTNIAPLAGFVGEIEFYPLAACSGSPEVGSVVGVNSSCNGNTKFYYLQNYISGGSINYQWQVSTTTPTGTYTNIGTNTTMLARTHGATNEYIRCIATCTISGLRDTTPIFSDTIKPFYLCYCASNATNIGDTKIDSVVFETIRTGSLSSTCEAYTDYRGLTPIPKLRASTSYTIDVVNGSCSGSFFNSAGSVFVDFNKSGVFDAAERTGTWTATGLNQRFSTSINIPLNPVATGITGLRVIHLEGTSPTTACGTYGWGETEDYLVEIIKDSVDARFNFVDTLENGCNMGNTKISFNASNIGHKIINPLPACYSVNGGTPVCENLAPLAIGATSVFNFSTLANLSGHGAKIVKIWHNNPLDTNKTNDTVFKRIVNFPTPPTPVADDDTVCVGSPQTIFRAPSFDSFMTRWYTDAAGTNEVGTGNQYVINNPTGNNTVYAKSIYSYTTNFGPTTTNPEVLVAAANQGLIFDVQRNKVKINYVTMKFNSTGIGAIEIRTSGGALLFTKSFIATTAGSMMIIPIGYELPIGTGYRILLSTNPGLTIARGSFTAFPQQIPTVIRITGSTTANQYNMFFDWNVTYDACESPLIPVKSVYINTTASPTKALFKDTFFCQYPDAYLDAKNAGSTYKWQDNSTNQKIKVTNSGLYIVTITNSVGCNIVDTSKVEVRVSPIFSLGNDTTICAGKSAILKSGFTNRGYNHVWSNGDLDPETEVRSAGTYSVNVFNTNSNCGYSDTVVVNVVPSPNAFLGRDTFACNNAPININAPTNANYQYLWDNGLTNSFRTVSAKGVTKAWVEITDISNAYGCKASDTVVVTIARLVKPNLGLDKVSCSATETIGVPDSSHLGYRWNSGETTSYISKSAAGTYILTVTEVNTTCSFSDTIKLSFIPTPPLDLGSDIFTCKKNPITLKANAGWTSYAWNNGFNTQSITVGAVTNSYSVTATNSCGTATDNISITIQDTVLGFNLPNDTTICNPITLNVPVQPLGNKIQWSTSEVSPSITVANSGVYWVSISNECGAKSDAIRVTKDTLPTPDFNTTQSGTFVSFTNRSINGVSYRWEFGDDSTSTDKNPLHKYLNKGTYSVKLIATNSCGDTVSRTKSIILYNSSISSVSQEAISVYPNPTSDKFIIQTNSISKDVYVIDLMTIDGRIIKNQESKFNSINEIELQVNEISAGTYWLRLTDKNQNQILKKVSITR